MKNTLTNEQLIAKAKQWVKELCESGGRKWSLRVPVDLNHDPDVIFIELCNRLEEYAQQSQPSGMRWGIDSPFPLLEIIKRLSGAVEYLLHRKDYDGPDYEELQICIKEAKKFISESSPAGAAEGASEGMAEALRKDIFRLDELRRFHIEPYNLGEMGEVSKIISRLSKLASLSTGVDG